MKQMQYRRFVFVLAALVAICASADEWYVVTGAGASDDNLGTSAEAPFATIDKAIAMAAPGDIIYVAAGTYATTNQWGPNLTAKLVGTGSTREEVVIQSAGTYRTLRMAAGSWLENVTVVGEGTFQADKGGAIEMSGGTVTNCVVRGGTAKANGNIAGGNLYVNNAAAVVDDCEIYGGTTHKRGGNVYLDNGTVRNCTIYGGTCDDNIGGNVYQYGGTVSNCVIYGGTALNDGGNVRMNGAGLMVDCVISNGTVTANEKKGANVHMDSSARMSRCRLVGGANSSGYNGGSLCVNNSSASVEDSLVEGSECGGVLLGGTSYLYNCTIVNNEQYGVWAWSGTQHIFNTVVLGNTKAGAVSEWTGNLPNSASAEFVNCALSSDNGRLSQSAFPTLVLIDASAFADYANGDYAPSPSGSLVDAGASDPRGASASAIDLAGAPRVSGLLDIGCYEYQKQDMTVRIAGATYSQIFAPASVTFSHVTENSASPENVVYTYDFGDGSEPATTSEATIAHAYAQPGVYTVTISATNDCEEEFAEMVYEGYVRVASSTVYVTPGNGAGTFPYNTSATGYGNLKTAVQAALDGYTLLLGEGVHTTSDQISFNKAITIRGIGATPDSVVVSNTVATADTYYHRTMEMNNATGRIERITIASGCVRNQYGGCLRLVAGVVSNCVIRGGLAVADGGNAAGAGVELAGTGILTHCVVSNNLVSGTSSSDAYAGGAVFFPYGSKGKMYNTLVVYNTYEPSTDDKRGAAGIRFGGGNEQAVVENCTVAANTVSGTISSASAGAFCNSWSTTVRNTVFAGNYETGTARYTSVSFDPHMNVVKCVMDDAAFNQYCYVAAVDGIFRDFGRGDFTPLTGGALFNKGNTPSVAVSVDLAGRARVFGKAIDIGCYECQRNAGLVLVFR